MRAIPVAGEKLTPKQVGATLARMREAVDLTQREVAHHFGVDKTAVGNWENARTKPSRDKLVELDDLYQAGGALLEMYGFTHPDVADTLRGRVDRHDERIAELTLAIDRLQKTVTYLMRKEPKGGAGHLKEQ